jgi:small neutral amino acid transporter SnatA (MarC family)
MYKNKSERSILEVALPAALGAGVVTSFAIAQGQHPAIALGITALVTIFAVACERCNLM